jgi:hypothetical protein
VLLVRCEQANLKTISITDKIDCAKWALLFRFYSKSRDEDAETRELLCMSSRTPHAAGKGGVFAETGNAQAFSTRKGV